MPVRFRKAFPGVVVHFLCAEIDDRAGRRRARRIAEARFPRIKRLADFNPDAIPGIAATLATLSAGALIDAGEPIVLLGDSGAGNTHLLIGLGLAACEQGRKVRYATTAEHVQTVRGRQAHRPGQQPHNLGASKARLIRAEIQVHRRLGAAARRPVGRHGRLR
jgi:DNA replication protein DnaC